MPFKVATRLTCLLFNTSRKITYSTWKLYWIFLAAMSSSSSDNVTLSVRPSICHTFFSFFPNILSKMKKISPGEVIKDKFLVLIFIFIFLSIIHPTRSHFTVIQGLTLLTIQFMFSCRLVVALTFFQLLSCLVFSCRAMFLLLSWCIWPPSPLVSGALVFLWAGPDVLWLSCVMS